jgi:hypothetical protein
MVTVMLLRETVFVKKSMSGKADSKNEIWKYVV